MTPKRLAELFEICTVPNIAIKMTVYALFATSNTHNALS